MSFSFAYQKFIRAIKARKQEQIERYLRDHPRFLDYPDTEGQRPLHVAVQCRNYFAVELLLQRGSISTDLPDSGGWTPLHLAAQHGPQSTVELLLRKSSVSLNSTTIYDWTPLYIAILNGKRSIIRIFKALGATVVSFSNLSETAIQMIQESIPEDEIIEIRFRIYFNQSLLSRLLS